MNNNNFYLIIRDNIHGDIEIKEKIIIELIDTPEFQRLRRINQLSGGQFIFPGACHTRFIHSLGVYYLVSKILSLKIFRKKYNNKKQILIIKIAALLHDIGHGPFSHTFEKINNINNSNIFHEDYSVLIIKNINTNINKILKKYFNNNEILEICDIIKGKYYDNILNSLVSSQLDADRLDYLLRDVKNTGVQYGNLDIQWIIRHFNIINNKIVFSSNVQYAIESYLISRFYMYKQIYLHPLSIAYDLTFEKLFKRIYFLYHKNYLFKNISFINKIKPLLCGENININDYCEFDDYSFFTYIKLFLNENDFILKKLSSMFINRNFFYKANINLNKFNLIKKKVQKIYKNNYNYFMIKLNLKSFKIYDKNKIPIYIKKNNKLKNIDKISNILSSFNSKEKKISYFFILKEFLKL